MPNIYEAPDITKAIELLLPTKIQYEGKIQTIDDWRIIVVSKVRNNRKQDKITTFIKFINGLLEGYGTKGEFQENQRYQLMKDTIHSFSDVTEKNIREVLVKNGYYRREKAIQIGSWFHNG